ncbi:uncharacterized protein LOC143426105 [Xylocopa sonorina]|uniref:uncharacterized protein LOC143426105 n=1 Tax=Xylocopa sonorina TaxID=1818115 RepID=UPI00403A912B
MKCIAMVVLLALVGVALAKPIEETELIEPVNDSAAPSESEVAARDKRGLLLGAAYTAPIAYTAPVAYTAAAAYSYPYATYTSYPSAYYASAYTAPYYLL